MEAYKRIIYFGNHSSLHGIRFLTESNRGFTCRLFWMCSLLLCGYGFREILNGAIKSSNEDALSFTLDTNYLHWQTVFPAVTVCEKYVHLSVLKRLNTRLPDIMKEYDFNYRKMLADASYGKGICNLCNTGCKEVNCSVDFSLLYDTAKFPCEQLIHTCKWMEQKFDCCQYFLPIDSDLGNCYSFNTRQSSLSKSVSLFKSNITSGPGYLTFHFFDGLDLDVFIHGTEEIPWKSTDMDTTFEAVDTVYFYFQLVEMVNEKQVRNLDLQMRRCRYYDEKLDNMFGQSIQVYSYSTCIILCETELIYKRCGCVSHIRDKIYKDFYCNYTGLGCVATYTEEKMKMSAVESSQFCRHCLPSCEDSYINKVFFFQESQEEDYDDDDEEDESNEKETKEDPHIEIKMVNLPHIRYRRNVVRTTLDLVVSVGGLIGLFFGASLLTLTEAIYLLLVRKHPK